MSEEGVGTEETLSAATATRSATVNVCCALYLGFVDWHNCGTVLGALECVWGLVWTLLNSFCTLFVEMGPLICCFVMGPRPGNVARGV